MQELQDETGMKTKETSAEAQQLHIDLVRMLMTDFNVDTAKPMRQVKESVMDHVSAVNMRFSRKHFQKAVALVSREMAESKDQQQQLERLIALQWVVRAACLGGCTTDKSNKGAEDSVKIRLTKAYENAEAILDEALTRAENVECRATNPDQLTVLIDVLEAAHHSVVAVTTSADVGVQKKDHLRNAGKLGLVMSVDQARGIMRSAAGTAFQVGSCAQLLAHYMRITW